MAGGPRGDELKRLHVRGGALVVPNAWDVASARALDRLGFPTIATSSAAVAWAAGYADGQRLPFERLVEATRAITAVVDVPVSVDAEGGYLDQTGGIEPTIERLVEAGASGVNLEDRDFEDPARLVEPERHAELVAAARAEADRLGAPLWINGRTDTFWAAIGDEGERAAEAVRRLSLYAQAGADGAFAPGLAAEDDIATVAREVPVPLNVMRMPGMASAEALGELGVARITVGANLIFAALAEVERIAGELKAGNLAPLDGALPSGELMQLLLSG